MSHRVTERMRGMVAELHELQKLVEGRLDVASEAAREEWSKLCSRLPGVDDLRSGYATLSETDLEEMKAKVCRFAEILRSLGATAGFAAPPECDQQSVRRPP